jgi:hypothetical protein
VLVASGTYDVVSPGPEAMALFKRLGRADIDDGDSAGKSAGLRDLRRRNGLLEQENEVLRRAAAYLPQSNLPSRSLDGVKTKPGQGDAWCGGMLVHHRS